jgi:hypothetical protein
MDPVSNPAILESSLSKSKNENSDFCLAINVFYYFYISYRRGGGICFLQRGKREWFKRRYIGQIKKA